MSNGSLAWADVLRGDFDKLAQVVGAPKTAVPKLREGERRRVAILFLDIKGFTSMSEQLDPEEVQVIIDNTFKIFTQVIEKYGGYVARYEGDCIIALFGSKRASEVDSERAVRAGLEMQARLRQINEILAQRKLSLGMRIGVNAGLVVTGNIGSDRDADFTVMGDAVNVAARLETTAPVGTVFISRETMEEAGDAFIYEPRGPVIVKGKSAPVDTYVVLGTNPRTRERWERSALVSGTQHVGREREHALLSDALEEARRGKPGDPPVVVELSAPAGMGKSRLVHHFLTSKNLWHSPAHVTGRATRFASPPLQLFSSIGREEWGLENPEVFDAKTRLAVGIDQLAAVLDPAQAEVLRAATPLVGYAIGVAVDDPRVRELEPRSLLDEVRAAFKVLLSAFAARADKHGEPLVLVLEDLQWMDSASQEALPFVVTALSHLRPPLVILVHRSEEPLPHSVVGPLKPRVLELPPLCPEDVGTLSTSILQEPLPSEARTLVVERADGNPFYVEELLRVFVTQGFLLRSGDQWVWRGDAASYPIPTTVAGIVLSGVDALPPHAKEALERAAVAGDRFDADLLRRVATAMNEPEDRVADGLRILEESGFISPQDDPGTYTFRQLLTREVAYGTLLRVNRNVLHRLVARAIEERDPDPTDQAAVLTHHYLRTDEPRSAMKYLRIALAKAVRDYHHDAALALCADGLRLLVASPEIDAAGEARFDILWNREQVEDVRADRESQRTTLDEMTLLAASSNVAERVVRAHIEAAMFGIRTGDFETSKRRGAEAVRIADEAGLAHLSGAAHFVYGEALLSTGEREDGREHQLIALHVAKEQNDRPTTARVYNSLGIWAARWNDLAEAHARFLDALEVTRALGDRRRMASVLTNLYICRLMGDYVGAREYSRQALAIHRELGNLYAEAVTLCNLGTMVAELGDYEEARAFFEQALAIHERTGDKENVVLSNLNLAINAVKMEDVERAQDLTAKSVELARGLGSRWHEVHALMTRADYLLMTGRMEDRKAALDVVDEAEKITVEIGHRSFRIGAQLRKAQIARVSGDLATARRIISALVADLESRGGFAADRDAYSYYYEAGLVFKALGDQEKTRECIGLAKQALYDRISGITDRQTREAVLFKVAAHREVLDAADAEGIDMIQ